MKADKWLKSLMSWDSDRLTESGNRIYEKFVGPTTERYDFDFDVCRSSDGWKQYDTEQDASYFGIWVHLEGRLVVTFAEGDLSVVVCEDNAHLRAELDSMSKFYGDPPPAFKVIDLEERTLTYYHDKRPTVKEGNYVTK